MMGGLGNQLFQLAYAKSLAQKTGEEIALDIQGYQNYKTRSFSLDNVVGEGNYKFMSDGELSMKYKISRKAYHVFQKVYMLINRKDKIGNKYFELFSSIGLYYNFDRYYYNLDTTHRTLNKYVYGYFQSEKYFEEIKNDIHNHFKVKTPPTRREKSLLSKIASSNSIAVSLRLGDDYVKSNSLNICTEDYYIKGLEYVFNKVENAKVFIFSDEIDKAKEMRFPYPVEFVEGFNDYESLRLMYSCDHFVISNSSFSWWGAYLSDNVNKIIVAPSKWYNNSFEKPDIFLESFNLIEVGEEN